METPPQGPFATAPDNGVVLPPPPNRWRSPWWLWILGPVLLVAVVFLQRPPAPNAQRKADLQSGVLVEPPGLSPDVALAKVVLAYHGTTFGGQSMSEVMEQQLQQAPAVAGLPAPPPKAAQDRFRLALLWSKIGKPETTAEKLAELKKEVDPGSVLHKDIATALDPDAADSASIAEFNERHGWFARVYLDDGSTGAISDAKADGRYFMRVVLAAVIVLILLLVGGFIALVVLALMVAGGRLKPWPITHAPPSEPGSAGLWIETVVVFIAGFMTLKLVSMGVLAAAPGINVQYLVWGTLLGQWALVLTLFWPRVRGMSREQHRAEAGWHRGRGVVSELGAGVVSYLAILPIYALVAIIVTVCMIAYYAVSGSTPPEVDDKIMDLAAGGTAQLIAVVLLATIWAPVVEETIFRGALFRALRPRWGLAIAGLGSAAVFAALHAYLIPQLFMVGTLGFCFALVREWRNSIVATMTAHALHNGLVFCFVAAVAPVMQG
jgi:membrane protease YdiL (CAAX protease family)